MYDERRTKLRLEAAEPTVHLIPILDSTARVRHGTVAADIQGTHGGVPSLLLRSPIDASDEDPLQPRGEPIGFPQRTKVSPSQDQRLLDRVLREVAVVEHELGNVIQVTDRLFGKRAERLPVAPLRSFHQVPLHVRPRNGIRLT